MTKVRKLAWIENKKQDVTESISLETAADLYTQLQEALCVELDKEGEEEYEESIVVAIEAAMDVAIIKMTDFNDTHSDTQEEEEDMTQNEVKLMSAEVRHSNIVERLDNGYYEEKGLVPVAEAAAEKLADEIEDLEEACKNVESCGTIIENPPPKENDMETSTTRTPEESLESLLIGDLTLNELLQTGLIDLEVFKYTVAVAEGQEVSKPKAQPKTKVQAADQGPVNLAVAYFLGNFMKAGQQYKVKSRRGDGMYTQLVAENPDLAITDVQFRKAINLLLKEGGLTNNVAELKAAGGNWAPKSRWFLPSSEG
jgi:hypothetical protein